MYSGILLSYSACGRHHVNMHGEIIQVSLMPMAPSNLSVGNHASCFIRLSGWSKHAYNDTRQHAAHRCVTCVTWCLKRSHRTQHNGVCIYIYIYIYIYICVPILVYIGWICARLLFFNARTHTSLSHIYTCMCRQIDRSCKCTKNNDQVCINRFRGMVLCYGNNSHERLTMITCTERNIGNLWNSMHNQRTFSKEQMRMNNHGALYITSIAYV